MDEFVSGNGRLHKVTAIITALRSADANDKCAYAVWKYDDNI